MVLSWEKYCAREEVVAEGYCNATRASYGLDNCTGDEDCETEPCRENCKWMVNR